MHIHLTFSENLYSMLKHLFVQVKGRTDISQIPQRLNRHSPVALYYQLTRILRAQIRAGVYGEREQLPSENQLAREYQVSRHVVRRALKALVDEGQIIAYQGAGYFVNRKRFRKALPRLGSHTRSMQALGRATETLVARQELVRPPDFIAEKMLRPNEYEVIIIERVSYLDDEPVCVIEAYYPIDYGEALLGRDLNNKSIYQTLEERCNLRPGRAETVISIAFADEHLSSLMQIREGAPLLHIGSFTWSTKNVLFEYSSGYYRSDRFELELQQT